MKTAQSIEQVNSEQAPKHSKRGKHPNSRKNLVTAWQPGESGNPSGKPGFDVGAFLCRRAIESNQQAIYEGISARAIAGEPYLLQIVMDRAYGKLKQGIIHTGDEDGGPIRNSIKVEFVDGK